MLEFTIFSDYNKYSTLYVHKVQIFSQRTGTCVHFAHLAVRGR